MKQIKKLLTLVTFVLALGIMLSVTTDAEAAVSKRAAGAVYVNPMSHSYTDYEASSWTESEDWDGDGKLDTYYDWDAEYVDEMEWKSVLKMRVWPNYDASFNVYFGREGDYISDVKVNKKGLTAGVTYQTNSTWSEGKYNCYGTITMIPQKAGTYTVSFNVRKADGSVAGSYKMKVYASDYGVYKQAKLGSKVVYKNTVKRKGTTFTEKYKSTYKVANSLKSAKLKLTAGKGYKITGLVYVSYNAKGKPVAKKVKNGGTIKLSQQYASQNYMADGRNTKSLKMYTDVYVSYKDKYLGTYVKYSVAKRHNQKMVKCVSKDQSGKVTTSYLPLEDTGYGRKNANFTFWRY
ncbi:MAG: hypothetical protein IJZ76_07280 [Lachnospiraceae bacterium]|nr:hypothetical protein [Lachnospiraceae bacterium]